MLGDPRRPARCPLSNQSGSRIQIEQRLRENDDGDLLTLFKDQTEEHETRINGRIDDAK